VEDENPLLIVNPLPYNPLANEEIYQKSVQTDGSVQFSHSLEEQIGGQLKAGFELTDLYEDRDTGLLSEYVPTFFATRSVKKRDIL
jgi:hypothetical protein